MSIKYLYILSLFNLLFGEAPSITSNGGGDADSIDYAENSTSAVTTVTSTDSDGSSTAEYSISGGNDSGDFEIDTDSGVLTFASTPNYESPTDSDTDNVIEFNYGYNDNNNNKNKRKFWDLIKRNNK